MNQVTNIARCAGCVGLVGSTVVAAVAAGAGWCTLVELPPDEMAVPKSVSTSSYSDMTICV